MAKKRKPKPSHGWAWMWPGGTLDLDIAACKGAAMFEDNYKDCIGDIVSVTMLGRARYRELLKAERELRLLLDIQAHSGGKKKA